MREHGAEIEMIATSALRPWARNARTHSKKQVRQIADGIAAFGFTNPALIDDDLTILAGHGRVAAARSLGIASVPCRRIAGMSEDEKRAYVLADNKLALNAGWDEALLAAELGALLESDFEISLTGFSIPEIDALIEGDAPKDPSNPRDDALCADAPALCRAGDLWALGPHRLICGEARARRRSIASWTARERGWCSRAHSITSAFPETRRQRRAMASSRWLQARCRPRISRPFSQTPVGSLRASVSTARSISSAWTGVTSLRCVRPATASMRR